MFMKKTILALATAGLLAGASLGPTQADSGVKVGSLICKIEGGIGFIITSKKDMTCTFNAGNGEVELYTGSIRKFGLDVGITGEATMVWAVFAPGKLDPGALRGEYKGATAEATAGIGAGANVLIGGSNRTISLQPVSVSGQTGLNVAAGVGILVLK